mmetsp:Transcript_906/g.3605  ORF Transcript_906/g.3605 Transcript_906/m.3605 type:complete len:317 (+) Transcript_906:586-1536(+)
MAEALGAGRPSEGVDGGEADADEQDAAKPDHARGGDAAAEGGDGRRAPRGGLREAEDREPAVRGANRRAKRRARQAKRFPRRRVDDGDQTEAAARRGRRSHATAPGGHGPEEVLHGDVRRQPRGRGEGTRGGVQAEQEPAHRVQQHGEPGGDGVRAPEERGAAAGAEGCGLGEEAGGCADGNRAADPVGRCCLLAKTRVKLLVSPPSPLTRRAQSMRPFSVRVMTLSLEITCTTPPHPERQSRFTPARMHCAMTSKSSSGSKSGLYMLSHTPNSDSSLLPHTTKLSVGAIAPIRSMPVMKGLYPFVASRPATIGSA